MFLRRNILFAAVTLCILSLFGCVEQIDKAAIMKAAISVADDQNVNLNNLFAQPPNFGSTELKIAEIDEKTSGDALTIENNVTDLPNESEKTNEIIADGNNIEIEESVDLDYDDFEKSVDNTSTLEKVDLQTEQSEIIDEVTVTAAIVVAGAVGNDVNEIDLNHEKENIADTSVRNDSSPQNDLTTKTAEPAVSLENSNVNKENKENKETETSKVTNENLGNKERESPQNAYTETVPQTVEKSDAQVVESAKSNNNSATEKFAEESQEYILNTNTKKFHKSSCGYAKQMKEENKELSYDRNAIIADGYSPCKRCNP